MKTFFDLRESLVEKSFDHQAAARKHDELAKKVDGKTKNNHVWSAHKDAAKAHKQAHSMMSRGDKPSALAKKKADAAKLKSQRAMDLHTGNRRYGGAIDPREVSKESVDLDERKLDVRNLDDLEEAVGDGEYDLSIAMHQWKQGRDRQRAATAAADKAKAERQKRRDAYAKRKAAKSAQKESVDLDENARVKAALRKIKGASMMDLERAGNNIRAYAKKSGGIDKKDFDTAADYVIALGRLNDPAKATKVKQDLTTHVGLQDTDVRDKIKSMLPKGLKI